VNKEKCDFYVSLMYFLYMIHSFFTNTFICLSDILASLLKMLRRFWLAVN